MDFSGQIFFEHQKEILNLFNIFFEWISNFKAFGDVFEFISLLSYFPYSKSQRERLLNKIQKKKKVLFSYYISLMFTRIPKLFSFLLSSFN